MKSSFSFRPICIASVLALSALLGACASTAVNFDDVKADPDTVDKGETLGVAGKVTSFGHSISTVTYSIVDSPAGIRISNNALGTDKFSWDLRSDAELKIVTTTDAPPGKYKLKIEAKADERQESTVVSFTVR